MKKILSVIIAILIISSSCKTNMISYGLENPSSNNILYKSINEELPRISESTTLIAKTVITKNCTMTEKDKEEAIKQINRLTTDITYYILEVQAAYSGFQDDSTTLNGLYGVELMLSAYKYSLSYLKQYIEATTPEEKYVALQTFFVINAEADAKLSNSKTLINSKASYSSISINSKLMGILK